LYRNSHLEGSDPLGRIYLITDEQFNDVVLQENAKQPDGKRCFYRDCLPERPPAGLG
jgi:hypothetical protein